MTQKLDETLSADGFDDAIIGLDTTNVPYRIVYCKEKMQEILVLQDKMSLSEAIEYLEFNVWYAWVDEGTPIYIESGSKEHVHEMLADCDLD